MKERWVCGREKEEQGRQEGSRMMKGPVRGRKKEVGKQEGMREKEQGEKKKKTQVISFHQCYKVLCMK